MKVPNYFRRIWGKSISQALWSICFSCSEIPEQPPIRVGEVQLISVSYKFPKAFSALCSLAMAMARWSFSESSFLSGSFLPPPCARSYSDSGGTTVFSIVEICHKTDKRERLKRICHQVFSTDETKDGDFIVFIQNAERTKNLIQCRAAGGNIVDNQDILFFQ